jgi:integrase
MGLSQPEKLLQSRLGHSSIVSTEIYMHVTDEANIEEAHENAGFIDVFVGGGNADEEKE